MMRSSLVRALRPLETSCSLEAVANVGADFFAHGAPAAMPSSSTCSHIASRRECSASTINNLTTSSSCSSSAWYRSFSSSTGSSTSSSRSSNSSEGSPTTHTELDPELLKDKYGYAVLGGVNPENTDPTIKDTPRINPKRVFQPGQTYSPFDLNPFAPKQRNQKLQSRGPPPIASSKEVQRYSDFKNIDFLSRFITDAGRLKSRRVTRLRPLVHSRLMRNIKLARVMALMPHEARYEDKRNARLRSFNAATLQHKARQGNSPV